jgi:hypothetical protein
MFVILRFVAVLGNQPWKCNDFKDLLYLNILLFLHSFY